MFKDEDTEDLHPHASESMICVRKPLSYYWLLHCHNDNFLSSEDGLCGIFRNKRMRYLSRRTFIARIICQYYSLNVDDLGDHLENYKTRLTDFPFGSE